MRDERIVWWVAEAYIHALAKRNHTGAIVGREAPTGRRQTNPRWFGAIVPSRYAHSWDLRTRLAS